MERRSSRVGKAAPKLANTARRGQRLKTSRLENFRPGVVGCVCVRPMWAWFPRGLPAAGTKAWLFADEIVVATGEDEARR